MVFAILFSSFVVMIACTAVGVGYSVHRYWKNALLAEITRSLTQKAQMFASRVNTDRQHQIADIGFRGARTKVNGEMVDAFDAFIAGRLGHNRRFNDLLKGKILAKDVHLFIDKLLRVYEAGKQGEETFADFTDRVPKDKILTALDWK